MKKASIILCALLVLALVIGCSADGIMSLGSSLGKLSDASLVSRNPYYVEKATENVKAFIVESEKAFVWTDPGDPERYDGIVVFKGDTEAVKEESRRLYLNTIAETVNTLLSARDSSANEKALRNAINARYEGLSYGKAQARTNLYDSLVREAVLGGLLLQIEDPQLNLVMLLHFFGIDANKDQVDSIKNGVAQLHNIKMPRPLQSSDYSIVIRTLLDDDKGGRLKSVIDAVKAMSSSDPGGKAKVDMTVLWRFAEDIEKQAEDREYQTVGDKIAVGIIYGIVSEIWAVDKSFRDDPGYKDPDNNPDYAQFFDFVFANDAAKASLDKVLSYFDAMSYIYNAKLDIAGLVSGAF